MLCAMIQRIADKLHSAPNHLKVSWNYNDNALAALDIILASNGITCADIG